MSEFQLAALGIAVASVLVFAARAVEARRRRGYLAGLLAKPAAPPSLYPRINATACICTGACITACPEKDVIAMVDGRPRLVRTSACVGHADCVRSCPVQAIELVLGTKDRSVEVPVADGKFETTVPGMFVAGEVTGVGLIHNAVAQGRQAAAAALARASLSRDESFDVVVVGAGPAGIGAALECVRRGARCRVFERATLGGAIQSYPRNKIVMSSPMELPGFGKVKLRRTTKEALVELFTEVVAKIGIDLVENSPVDAITQTANGFAIESAGVTTHARHVILAIGRRGTPRKLGVPGGEAGHVVYEVTEPAHYAGKHCVVVGGGDSAIETALLLAAQRETTVTLVHRGDDFGRAKPDNQDALASSKRVRVALRARVTHVHADRVEIEEAGTAIEVPANMVACCMGGELPTQWLRGLGLQLRALRGDPLPILH